MNPERWRQIEDLYHSALEQEPDERLAFLEKACDGDSELRREVESLLAHEAAGAALLELVGKEAANELRGLQRLAPGTDLGPYRIVSELGAGGMGEVYRARDTRLDRTVALKVLPSHLRDDPKLRKRFEREARAVSSLNHPHICTLHDIGRQDGIDYLVMEYLEGETLADRLRKGPLPMNQALEYGIQIADALAQAHGQGVLHRDLKPGNIMLTRSGAKLLDFGLAKRCASPVSGGSAAVTQTELTEEGTILGTLHYMAPEQLEGKEGDASSDVFSFGAVLYEMLTGRKAFPGETKASVIASVLTSEPPAFSALPQAMPMELSRIVKACLAKKPEERWESARDLSLELKWVAESVCGVGATRPAAASSFPLRPALALVVVTLAGLTFMIGRATAPAPPVTLPTFLQITFRQGVIPASRFAPDGQTIIYTAAWDGKPAELFTTRADGPESRPLGLGSAGILAVSSLGELAITSGCELNWGWCSGTLARVLLAGGSPRQLIENVYFADWSPDGKDLAVVRASKGRFLLEFPIGKVLYETAGWITHARVSPRGDMIAFIDHPIIGAPDGSVAVVDHAGKKRAVSSEYRRIMGLAWHAGRNEIWFTANKLGSPWRSLHAVTPEGRERLVAHLPDMTLHEISREGRVLLNRSGGRGRMMFVAPGSKRQQDLSWFNWSSAADISRDGGTVLFYEWPQGGALLRPVVYLRKTDGTDPVRLGEGKALALSPNGKLALTLQETAPAQLILLPTGAGEPIRLPRAGLVEYYSATWFPDGTRILFVAEGDDHSPRSYVQDISGGPPQPVTPLGVMAVLVSPDGKRLVAYKDGNSYLYSLDGGAAVPIPAVLPGETLTQWSADGCCLFVRAPGDQAIKIFRIDLATGQRQLWREFALPDPVGNVGISADPRGVLVTPDGKSFAYTYWSVRNELYLVDGFR